MKKINLSLFALVSVFSLSSFASIWDGLADTLADQLYVDDQGALYCEVKCGETAAFGAYQKEVDGSFVTLPGSWTRLGDGGASVANQKARLYVVNNKVQEYATQTCNGALGNLIDGNKEIAKKVRFGIIEESQCVVTPYVTAKTGKYNYELFVPKAKAKQEL
jgi:hypothetical protein